MIKVALGQFEVQPGRPDLNTKSMLEMIQSAKEKHIDLIVFPELAIPGYLLGDTWEQKAFLSDCEYHGKKIIAASKGICIIFGNIAIDWNKKNNDGRVRKYNACFIAHQEHLLSPKKLPYPFVIKTLHPNYREFDDTRHFYDLQKLALENSIDIAEYLEPVQIDLPTATIQVGCLLCEDGWSDHYALSPMDVLLKHGPIDFFVNISSSPFTLGKNTKRNHVFGNQARTSKTPLLYVNHTGIQNNGKTVYTFDGSSSIYSSTGSLIACAPSYQEHLLSFHLPLKNDPVPAVLPTKKDTDIACIYQSIHYGIQKFLHAIHMRKVVIGASGGIDSAVAAALYTKVLGPENVLLVNMPSIYNSDTTKTLAHTLAKNLKCLYTVLPIQSSVDQTVAQFTTTPIQNFSTNDEFHLSVSPFVTENIQARDRSSRILAGIAASFGGGFTCNANKSETTVGYSTLYGDQSGFLAALADLWKFQVYDLARYLNKEIFQFEAIPTATIRIVPSAELSFQQAVDEGKGDPIHYDYHDYLFRAFMESWDRATPEDILQWYQAGVLEDNLGCEKGLIKRYFPTTKAFIEDLERWWNLYTGMAVAKRIQSPPILAVSRRAYGFDHREAQNGPYYTAAYLRLKEVLLSKK